MGLNYNYLLYFKREHLWDALQGVAAIADPIDPPPTTIHFPDGDLLLPIATDFGEEKELPHDRPEYEFALSLVSEADNVLLEYLLNNGNEGAYHAPPDADGGQASRHRVHRPDRLCRSLPALGLQGTHRPVLFRFGTTGTWMSMLFHESGSIPRTSIELLERHQGVCGIPDLEMDHGRLFWLKGKKMETSVWDVYMLPEEIEEMLERGW